MARIYQSYNFGKDIIEKYPELNRQLEDLFTTLSAVLSRTVVKHRADTDPPASSDINKDFDIGDIWVNKTADTAYIMTSRTTDIAVTWTIIT